MGMSKQEAKSFESICNTIVDGLRVVARKLNTRVCRLEAENKELRKLWIEGEKDWVELKCRVDKIETKLSKVKEEL